MLGPIFDVNNAVVAIASKARDLFVQYHDAAWALIFAVIVPAVLSRLQSARQALRGFYDVVGREVQKIGKGPRLVGEYRAVVEQPERPKLKARLQFRQRGNRVWGGGLLISSAPGKGIPRINPIVLSGTISRSGHAELVYRPKDPTSEGRGTMFLKVDKYTGVAEGNFSGLSLRNQEPVYGTLELRKVRLRRAA
jgi:hypothetical protein